MSNKKLSEDIELYYSDYSKSSLDSWKEIVEAVRGLEAENERLKEDAASERRTAIRFREERDDLHKALATVKQARDEFIQKYCVTVAERDEAREYAKFQGDLAKKAERERDAALAKLAQAEDRWGEERAELNLALNKLDAVREWADENTIEADFRARKLYAIIDAGPAPAQSDEKCDVVQAATTPYVPKVGDGVRYVNEGTWYHNRKGTVEAAEDGMTLVNFDENPGVWVFTKYLTLLSPSAKESQTAPENVAYDIVEREVVLWSYQTAAMTEPLVSVWEADCVATCSPDGKELARATVSFKVPKPAKKSLAERLRIMIGASDKEADVSALLAEVAALEGKVKP